MEIQAQNAKMQLFAQKTLTMTSTEDVLFAGKKRVTLIGGGSYLKLEAGRIEYGTVGNYIRRAPRTFFAKRNAQEQKPVSLLPSLPDLSCGLFAACFRVLDSLTGNEDMNFAYQVQTSTGAVQGITDSALTHTVSTDTEENVNLDYVFQIRVGTR